MLMQTSCPPRKPRLSRILIDGQIQAYPHTVLLCPNTATMQSSLNKEHTTNPRGCLGQHWVERYWWNSISSWNCLKGPTVGIYQAVGNDGCPDCAATYDIGGEVCFPWFWQLHTACHQKSAMFLFGLLTWRKWKANSKKGASSIFIWLLTCHETIMNTQIFR